MFCMDVLDLPPLVFAPCASINYINPLLSTIIAPMGCKIFRQVEDGFLPAVSAGGFCLCRQSSTRHSSTVAQRS